MPILSICTTLNDQAKVKSYREELKGKSGVYAFINTINGKQYIGSAKDFSIRLSEHLGARKSNIHLQRAISVYGKENFHFVIYAYAPYILPDILLLENEFIQKFLFDQLYNQAPNATSMLGYRHSDNTKAKMSERMIDPSYNPMAGKTGEAHPMFGKKGELSHMFGKNGPLNPFYGQKHSSATLELFSARHIYPVSLYDHNNVYILTFKNTTKLSEFVGCSEGTVRKYKLSKNLFKGKYYFKSSAPLI